MKKFSILWLALIAGCSPAPHEEVARADGIVYPADSGVVDVSRPPYNVRPGAGDVTSAIQRALDDHPSLNAIVYLPNGVYNISQTLRWPKGTDESNREKRTILQGQSTEGVVLRLRDNAPGFGDAAKPQAMLWTGTRPAQRFGNEVRNLTLDAGQGNPGAIGIQFNTSNQGCIRDVVVRAPQGSGYWGIDMQFTDEVGPLLMKNVTVDGFAVGIKTGRNINSQTLEDVHLTNQREFGISNDGQALSIHRLRSDNRVPAIRNAVVSSLLVLVDADLRGGAPENSAIVNEAGAHALYRDVRTQGYGSALRSGGELPGVAAAIIDEWVSGNVLSLFPSPMRGMRLPIQDTPQVPWGDPARDWVSPVKFGAVAMADDARSGEDVTKAFQAALDSGQPTVYFPRGRWQFDGEVTVPAHVRRIIGCKSSLRGKGTIRVEADGPPLIFEQLEILYSNVGFTHASPRTLIFSSSVVGHRYKPEPGAGDLFLNDVVGGDFVFLKGQNVWARQFNVENFGTKILNDGATLWILGYKTERPDILIHTRNGGKTEVLGGLNYSTAGPKFQPVFILEDSQGSFTIAETNNNRQPFHLLVRETRRGQTKTLFRDEAPPRGAASFIPLYSGWSGDGDQTKPVVRTKPPLDIVALAEAGGASGAALPTLAGDPAQFPANFKVQVMEHFDWLEAGADPNGQHGWETTTGVGRLAGRPTTAGVKPAFGNTSAGAFAMTGSRGSGMAVAEKRFPELAAAPDATLVYSATIRAVPVGKNEDAWETWVAPRVPRAQGAPIFDGNDAVFRGLGPRFGLARKDKDGKIRFRVMRAEKQLTGANRSHIFVSRQTGNPGDWYELRLVVQQDVNDPRNSTGTLYYRNVTAGDPHFYETSIKDVTLGFSKSVNPATFGAWSIVGKLSGEYDNLAMGVLQESVAVQPAGD